jgi:hypothetical protein
MNLPQRHPAFHAFALTAAAALAGLTQPATAQNSAGATTPPASSAPLNISVTLDGGFNSRELALLERSRGFSLGHNELSIGGNIDNLFAGRATAVIHEHEGEAELELEEAYLQSLALPAGLQLRLGRFLSSIGQLNEQHLHADDFSTRPLLYRAFLGGHYADDGLRLSWVAPTALYWAVSAEAFSGKRLVPEGERDASLGAWTLSTRLGGDIGRNQSWQVGLGVLGNRRGVSLEEHGHGDEHGDEHEDEHEHEHAEEEHSHAHGAEYVGRRLTMLDGVWKWAPNGNNRERQLRVSGAVARVTGVSPFGGSKDIHEAVYAAVTYRFRPQWEAGVRFDRLKLREPHEDHFDTRHLDETSLALTWKPTHFSALRLQVSDQRNVRDFDEAQRTLMLQYTVSLGAHGAHGF